MIQDTAWSPRFVPSTTATAATSGEAIAGTDTTKFITPSLLPAATSYHAGPVVNARAPRQGLVFDSSAHGGAPIANQPAFGTSDFTLTAWVNPVAVASNAYILSSVADSASLFFTGSTVQWIANASAVISVAGGVVAGKSQLLVITRNAGTTTYYYNGVAVSTAPSGSGNLANPIVKMGSSASGASGHFNGTISALIYNRALSASEVVALYEAGAPSGADYNSASNTAVYSTDFSSSTGWSLGGSTTISGGKLNLSNNDYAGAPSSTALAIGKRYRFTVTVDSITAGNVSYFNGASYVSFATSAGTYTVDFTAGGSYSFLTLRSDGGNAVCDTFAFYKTGLLLAPDAAQAGGGLVWYDTSGNAANITLPASGVSWNVPSSRVLGGNWTTSGNLTVSGTGTSSVAGPLKLTYGTNLTGTDIGLFATSGGGLYINAPTTKNIRLGFNLGDRLTLDENTATFATNLTVSGTGTSSVAGNFQIGGAPNIAPSTIDRYSSVNVTNVADFPAFSLSVADGSKNVRGSMYIDSSTTQEQFAWDFSYSSASFPQYKWKIAGTTVATLRDNGNFILSSTGTDGGQKLQVDGNSGFLGHLEIPADKHIYMKQSNPLRWSSDGLSTGSVRADVYADSGGALYLRTNGSNTALTLDSSQNATFAGNVTASGGTALFQATNANSIVHIKSNSDTYNPYIRLEGYNRNIYVGVKDAGADGTFNISTAAALTSPMLSLDPATNGATFAGAIAIGNTVAAAAGVASTHKVTISIGGSTYYLLATNV